MHSVMSGNLKNKSMQGKAADQHSQHEKKA